MHPQQIMEAYRRGENISLLLREERDAGRNTEETVEIAYDLQTGSYVEALNDAHYRQHKVDYGNRLAAEIIALTRPTSLLEVGVGEGITLRHVIDAFPQPIHTIHGFDISWSRIACCRDWFVRQGINDCFLSVASVFQTPYADNSFDVVYTSHSIEPNGGNERAILAELFRITSRYLFLLEPGYELATDDIRARMRQHGYCTGIVEHAVSLGMEVVKHEAFPFVANPMNPTALTVLRKDAEAEDATPQLACPKYRTPLVEYEDSLFSADSLRSYPKIQGIPCLRCQDAVIASAYQRYRPVA
ncbi:MAG: class I SAM-dependent methyltransferase [Planctomycetaceae bacterium]|nr:class I SAM-dependent methyltransferase [Planctomycetales bacterium]MCB9925740.1 class I SAM-dependent methyltransferase [Planctomycetaceae bacterium]